MNHENPELSKELRLQESFGKLQRICEVLAELGMKVRNDLVTVDQLKRPTATMGFPIVSDGLDGIRASYSSN
jgi:hypothetical protein